MPSHTSAQWEGVGAVSQHAMACTGTRQQALPPPGSGPHVGSPPLYRSWGGARTRNVAGVHGLLAHGAERMLLVLLGAALGGAVAHLISRDRGVQAAHARWAHAGGWQAGATSPPPRLDRRAWRPVHRPPLNIHPARTSGISQGPLAGLHTVPWAFTVSAGHAGELPVQYCGRGEGGDGAVVISIGRRTGWGDSNEDGGWTRALLGGRYPLHLSKRWRPALSPEPHLVLVAWAVSRVADDVGGLQLVLRAGLQLAVADLQRNEKSAQWARNGGRGAGAGAAAGRTLGTLSAREAEPKHTRTSAMSQGPLAALHTVPWFLTLSAGQAADLPVQYCGQGGWRWNGGPVERLVIGT